MPFFSLKTSCCIGLEVQAHEIRFIQLKKLKRTYRLEQAIREQIPAGILLEGKISDWQRLSSMMAEWVRLLNWQGLQAAILLPSSLVRMQQIQVSAALKDQAIENEIEAQVRRDLPGMHEALSMDYTVLSRDANGADIFFSVTRQDYLAKYIDCVNAAGLRVKIADIDIYALTRFMQAALSLSLQQGEIGAMTFVTKEMTRLIIFNRDVIIFHHDWNATDFLTQWRAAMQLAMSTFATQVIQHFYYYGPSAYFDMIMNDALMTAAHTEHCTKLFDFLQIGSMVDAAFMTENAPYLAAVCGAAMREVPKW